MEEYMSVNYMALYLCIKKKFTVQKSLRLMGLVKYKSFKGCQDDS